jgi:hypothetical protein
VLTAARRDILGVAKGVVKKHRRKIVRRKATSGCLRFMVLMWIRRTTVLTLFEAFSSEMLMIDSGTPLAHT